MLQITVNQFNSLCCSDFWWEGSDVDKILAELILSFTIKVLLTCNICKYLIKRKIIGFLLDFYYKKLFSEVFKIENFIR